MPGDLIVRLQHAGEVGVAGGRRGGVPPDPAGFQIARQPVEGGCHADAVQDRIWRSRWRGAPRGDHEQAGARLRGEPGRVGLQRPEPIAAVGQRAAQGGEILAPVGIEQADHVLDHDHAGGAAFAAEGLNRAPEPPERRGPRAAEPRPIAGEAHVLAGRGRPGQIGGSGKLRRLDAPDVAEVQILAAPVGPVRRRLHRIEIVGEQAAPALAQPRPRHAPAGEELVEGEGRAHTVRLG